MKVDEFLHIMEKVKRFKTRLKQENITGHQAETILIIYINDLTSKINTNLLRVV